MDGVSDLPNVELRPDFERRSAEVSALARKLYAAERPSGFDLLPMWQQNLWRRRACVALEHCAAGSAEAGGRT